MGVLTTTALLKNILQFNQEYFAVTIAFKV